MLFVLSGYETVSGRGDVDVFGGKSAKLLRGERQKGMTTRRAAAAVAARQPSEDVTISSLGLCVLVPYC